MNTLKEVTIRMLLVLLVLLYMATVIGAGFSGKPGKPGSDPKGEYNNKLYQNNLMYWGNSELDLKEFS